MFTIHKRHIYVLNECKRSSIRHLQKQNKKKMHTAQHTLLQQQQQRDKKKKIIKNKTKRIEHETVVSCVWLVKATKSTTFMIGNAFARHCDRMQKGAAYRFAAAHLLMACKKKKNRIAVK